MSFLKSLQYNGKASGSLTAEFTRNNAAAGDGDYTVVSANERRFAKTNRCVMGAPSWTVGSVINSGTAILATGTDYDGTPLILIRESTGNTIQVWTESGGALSLLHSVAYTGFSGYTGSITYGFTGGNIYHGLLVLTGYWSDSGAVKGPILFYSSDTGQTWNAVINDVTGNARVEPHSAAPTYSSCTAHWSRAQAFPAGGIDASGNYDKTDAFFIGTDYAGAGAPLPSGGMVFCFRATRPSEVSSVWTVQNSRRIYARWGDTVVTAAGYEHCHHAAVADQENNANVIVSWGDDSGTQRFDYLTIDLENYLTESLVSIETVGWHGAYDISTTKVAHSPQPVAFVPIPGYALLASSDEQNTVMLKIGQAASSASTPDLTEVLKMHYDALTTPQWDGPASLSCTWNPGIGWCHGAEPEAKTGSKDLLKYYSPNATDWYQIPGAGQVIDGPIYCIDGYFVGIQGVQKPVHGAIPTLKKCKPFLSSPGGRNYADITLLTVNAAVTSPNVVNLVDYSPGSGYTYHTGGAPVSGAPDFPPPTQHCKIMEVTLTATAATNRAGTWWVQQSGQTIPTGLTYARCWGYALNKQTTTALWIQPAVSPGTQDNIERSMRFGDNNNWMPLISTSNVTVTGRGFFPIWGSPSSTTYAYNNKILLCVCDYHANAGVIPYSVDPSITSPANEVDTITGLPDTSSAWSVGYTGWRSNQQVWLASYATAMQTLLTMTKDGSNYATVSANYNTITVAGQKGGTPFSDSITGIYWLMLSPLTFVLTSDGTDLAISAICGSHDVSTLTLAGSGFTDLASMTVGYGEIGGIGVSDASLDSSERNLAIKQLTWLNLTGNGTADRNRRNLSLHRSA